MDDIVDRLRAHWRAAGQGCTSLCMMCAAADEIERLRRENDNLKTFIRTNTRDFLRLLEEVVYG